ncbi:hypothetical protein [Acinetobacter sp.]|uniref:hypothetical protein n=1 Tax=Acinetobacter sp. TaxID=472 RepID=UPI002FC65414
MNTSFKPLGMQEIIDFDGARDAPSPAERLENVRVAAHQFRQKLMQQKDVGFYQSIDLVRAPYPTWYGYTGVFAQKSLTFPFLHLLNRLFVIQYQDFNGKLKVLLFSPTDVMNNRKTPFFERLAGALPESTFKVFAPQYSSVEQSLEKLKIKPEQVDYISYDHLHTQELRKWLGTTDQPAYFPNAKLLVHEKEWNSVQGLLPVQSDWYCPHATEGIDPKKIITFQKSLALGSGLALVHTPGHTEGNHSLVAKVDNQIFVTSENGISLDAYEPKKSKIKAIRDYAAKTGVEVILNGNTQEGSNDQYISMVLEKTIAGPLKSNPDFPACACSSETTPYWLFPSLKQTELLGALKYGQLVI